MDKCRRVIKDKSSKWKQANTISQRLYVSSSSVSEPLWKILQQHHLSVVPLKDVIPLLWLKVLYKNSSNKGAIMTIHQTSVKHWFPYPALATVCIFSSTVSFRSSRWIFPQHALSTLSDSMNCHFSASAEKRLPLLDWQEERLRRSAVFRLMEHLMRCLLWACCEAPITDYGYWWRRQKPTTSTTDRASTWQNFDALKLYF